MSSPLSVDELATPALLVERSILAANISAMQRLADSHGVALRPHIKTHKSVIIAKLQLETGARGIACATIDEAEAMAAAGIHDIAIANQVVGDNKINRLLALSSLATVSCAVDSLPNVEALSAVFAAAGRRLPVLIEIDTGLHRCGLTDYAAIKALATAITGSAGLNLRGIMTHAGHAYAAAPDAIARIGDEEGRVMAALAERLRADGHAVATVSVGSTPTARQAVSIPGVTELRPGNYVFCDMMQVSLGVATLEQCALSVLATVISTPSARRAVVDAGSKALSSDTGAHGNRALTGYGHIRGTDLTVTRLSEEHGVIEGSDHRLQVGQRVWIIPNHACAVVNLFDRMYLCDDEVIVAECPVESRRRSLG